MKIIPENIVNNNKNIARKQSPEENKTAPEPGLKASGQDKITIEANQNAEMTDSQFISQLKRSILSEIQAGAPEHKLDDLKKQIALNEYDINIPDIIRKMLLDSQEACNE